jgi:5,10-methylenetetrahydrofolate reductase
MTITIDESKLNGLNAIVADINAQIAANTTEGDPITTTPQEYLEARINDTLESYDRQLIEQAKAQYDEVITIAATLSPEKQAELVAKVQELAATS